MKPISLRRVVCRCLLVFLALSCPFAAVRGALPVEADSAGVRLARQVWAYPQEKVHVTTDQCRYVAGDTVWLRAWVVDASTHRQVCASRYVYLELSDPFGSVVERVKLRERDGRFPGYLALDPELAEGDYTLTAYTSFMEGPGTDYFFRKRLGVVSAYAGQVSPEVSFVLDEEGRVEMTALLRDSDGGMHWYESMTVTAKSGKVREWRKSDSARRVRLSDEDLRAGVVLLSIDNYRKYISLPSMDGGIDVTFHPEGGYLVAGEGCRVGVKAIDGAGRGVDVEGVIRDSSGTLVDSFRTVHRGMGEFSFVPVDGESYVAEVCGVTYPLPTVRSDAAVLHVDTGRKTAVTAVAVGSVPGGSVLAVQNRGRMVYAGNVEAGLPVRIPREYLGEGVVQFLLLDGAGRALSERLAFNRGTVPGKPSVSVYSTERSRTLTISFPEEMRGSDVAVAVLDGGVAEPDSSVTIESQLLLQGDLRGHVEDAGWYFRHAGREVDVALDALMLTQGWRRYDVPSVLAGIYSAPTSAIEVGPEITGVVKSRWRGKPMEGATVNVLAPSIDYAGTALTDSEGRFAVTDVDFPEGTKFVVQALNPKGDNEHNFEVDVQTFPASASIAPEASELGSAKSDTDDGIDYGWRVSHVNGNMSVTLGEITVRRHKRKDPEDIYEILASRTFTSDEMEKDHITSYEEALRKIPGMIITNGNVFFRNRPVAFRVDDFPWTQSLNGGVRLESSRQEVPLLSKRGGTVGFNSIANIRRENAISLNIAIGTQLAASFGGQLGEFASSYPIEMMSKIQFLHPNESMIFGVYPGGVLRFTTKTGAELKNMPSIFLKLHAPLGYQKPVEFYTPKYEFVESLDYPTRSTLYWMPVNNVNGDMVLNIPEKTSVVVVVEGLTSLGDCVRMSGGVE